MAGRGPDEPQGNLRGSGRPRWPPSGPGSTVPGRKIAISSQACADCVNLSAWSAERRASFAREALASPGVVVATARRDAGAPSGAPLPSRGANRTTAYPAPHRNRAAERWLLRVVPGERAKRVRPGIHIPDQEDTCPRIPQSKIRAYGFRLSLRSAGMTERERRTAPGTRTAARYLIRSRMLT
jgi:hypothetical protein